MHLRCRRRWPVVARAELLSPHRAKINPKHVFRAKYHSVSPHIPSLRY